ncbi:DEAD/DEAH box helicase [Candidatus Poriferisodalis sp.]|uniref:C-terminal helicase domain-containing protein n=1 Tax=Candidatus Poriferisodalis sp. TaxID=3101277 RepID=UPI003C6FE0A4
MTGQHIDVQAVLGDLKDFQQRTARWTFERMFDEQNPAVRFLVADEVGLGKTHVAKGVIAQVIDYLGSIGDARHDIVYVCSNAAIARQNLRKLVPKGIEPLEDVGRLAMLPLAELNDGDGTQTGVNLLAITPGTSLKFGRSTGTFRERCLAYTFLRAHWGAGVMTAPARWIFWEGITAGDPDERLRAKERWYRSQIAGSLGDFTEELGVVDESRNRHAKPTLRALFDKLVDGLKWKRAFPDDLWNLRRELIGEVRRIMAIVGIAALQPDLVVLDEFQRFKDLLQPDPDNFAAELAHRLFDYEDPETGRATRTLLLSATPYRMYTTADEIDSDHYADFVDTCSFLFQDPARVERLQSHFAALRSALTSVESFAGAESICGDIGSELRDVMARTERLAATPDRDGMLRELDAQVAVEPDDLRAYLRIGDLAETVEHHEPTEYWKSGPYLVNFMERYKLKQAVVKAADEGRLADDGKFDPGPGLLSWEDVEAYQCIDPQNGRLRWLLDDLERHRAFELLWMPPSLRYYDTRSVYEAPEAASFTKRLIFSSWAVVPKVVSSLVSFEAERHAFAGRSHGYTAEYGRRGGQRLDFRTSERFTSEARPGEARAARRAATMTAFLFVWPSPSLAELGYPRQTGQGERRQVSDVLTDVAAQVADAIAPLIGSGPTDGVVDRRWYWAAPLYLDQQLHPSAIDLLLASDGASHWEGDQDGSAFRAHLAEARSMVEYGHTALGRPPDDLAEVLAEVALGGPAQCALRAVSAAVGLPISHESTVSNAAWIAAAFRGFFNAPEVTGVVVGGRPDESDSEDGVGRYWRDVLRHSIDGNLQAVLDEHAHVLRDWLGHLSLSDDDRRIAAADDIGYAVAEALDLRTSSFRVDIPRRERNGQGVALDRHTMRTRFAVAFGNQTLDGGGEARVESVSRAFNSPFWPFVLTSTSVGQEGLDFHLWCHAVVHWNLPSNPVDLEQREGRVHRYKGHAVRRNIAATLGPDLLTNGLAPGVDLWNELFAAAAATRGPTDGEMVPYWVFHRGPAKIERHVPVLPFSRDAAAVPQLRKSLAAYRLAFGQPRQEELVEFLGADRTDEELLQLASRLRINLAPPEEHPV